jgi:hypothetical protein
MYFGCLMVLMENAKCTLFSGGLLVGDARNTAAVCKISQVMGCADQGGGSKTLSQWAQELETRSRRPPVLPWRDQAHPAASDSSASDQSAEGNVLSSIVIDSLEANVSWDWVCPSENLIQR